MEIHEQFATKEPARFMQWYVPQVKQVRRFLIADKRLEGGYYTVAGRTYVVPVWWNAAFGRYESYLSYNEITPDEHYYWCLADGFLRSNDAHLVMPGVANLPHLPIRRLSK